jgi:sulfur relay (sulfurtransferase) complex TusBCD TusD component (DsrE family)
VADYLLIESRDPFESNDARTLCDLALQLRRAGNGVALFLVQNGVLPARAGVRAPAAAATLGAALDGGIEVYADEVSLAERGIAPEQTAAGVRRAPIDLVVDRLAAGHIALWH